MQDDKVKAFAYQIPWNDLNGAKLRPALHKKDYKVRMAVKESSYNGKYYSKRSLMVNVGDNKRKNDFDKKSVNLFSHMAYLIIQNIRQDFRIKAAIWVAIFLNSSKRQKYLSFQVGASVPILVVKYGTILIRSWIMG